MRLFELINFDPADSQRDLSQYRNTSIGKAGLERVGAHGTFGNAYKTASPKRLNQITKISRIGNNKGPTEDIKEDGYLIYMRAVDNFEKSGGFNPYFPKIHDLNIKRSKDNSIYYRINLEKLYAFQTEKIINNVDLIKSLYEQMFFPNTISNNVEDYDGLVDAFTYEIFRMLENSRYIKDENLSEAVDFIQSLNSKNKFHYDLHAGNIMWRITGTMPQLVLLDPLY